MRQVDVAIIGVGSAGLSARKEVEKLTDSYIMVDGGPLGTTCARVGCMPSKVLIEVANNYNQRKKFEKYGISGGEFLKIDTKHVMSYVRSLRDKFVSGVMAGISPWENSHLIRANATFIDHQTLQVGDQMIKAKSIIIATGSRPIVPKAWLQYKSYFIDSDDFFELENLPQNIGVIGAGVIGLELGQALHRIGINMKAFTAEPTIGGISDPELASYAMGQMNQEFPIIHGVVDIKGERNGQIVIESNGQEYVFDKLFLAMGRRPNIDNIGLEKLDLPRDQHGIPGFSRTTFQIENTRLFIAGDCLGERPLLHEASDEGRIAGFNAARQESQCFMRRSNLSITFSDPNIALVGQYHRELIANNSNFVTAKVKFNTGRAVAKGSTNGLAHLYADPKNGKLLGAELFVPDGEHLAHLLSWAISANMDVHQILAMPFYHPVLEESLSSGFRDLATRVETKSHELEVLRCQDVPVFALHHE